MSVESPNTPRSKISKLWADFWSEWNKRLITGAVALSFAALGLLGRTLWPNIKRSASEIRTLSPDDAKKIADTELGSGVVRVFPFREATDATQHIWAVVEEAGSYHAYLLSQNLHPIAGESPYTATRIKTACDDFGPAVPINTDGAAGVLDLRHDGNHQVFANCSDGGTGLWTLNMLMIDMPTSKQYRVAVTNHFDERPLDYGWPKDIDTAPEIKQWFIAEARQDTALNPRPDTKATQQAATPNQEPWDLVQLARETRVWREANGDTFQGGTVSIHIYPGKPPVDPQSEKDFCPVIDGDMMYISQFKGPLFAYNRKRNEHFVIYVPEYEHAWEETLDTGDRYLWFRSHFEMNDNNAYSWAFDKTTHELRPFDQMKDKLQADHVKTTEC